MSRILVSAPVVMLLVMLRPECPMRDENTPIGCQMQHGQALVGQPGIRVD